MQVQKVETITKNSLADGTGSGDQLRPMFTTSAQLLFPKLTPSESVRTTASPSGSSSDGRLRSLLCATVRADFVAGNPLLRYLSACSSRESQDHLLFWWSVELVLTQDEMERYYQARVPAADCPYLTSFETQPVAQTMSELLVLFVEEGARHPVSLPQPLLNGLGTCLRKGMGRSLLLYAQEHVIEVSGGRGCRVGGALVWEELLGMKWEGLQGVRLLMTLHPISETSTSVEAVFVAR